MTISATSGLSVYSYLMSSLNTNNAGSSSSSSSVNSQLIQSLNEGNNSSTIVNPVDLSNYYTSTASGDLLTEIANNVSDSANTVQEAMISVLENGMSVNDACNISSAMAAYQANCSILKSTFSMYVD